MTITSLIYIYIYKSECAAGIVAFERKVHGLWGDMTGFDNQSDDRPPEPDNPAAAPTPPQKTRRDHLSHLIERNKSG